MKRDANIVYAAMESIKNGYVAKMDMYIDVPQIFEERGLLKLKEWTAVIGSFLMSANGAYCVMNANAYLEMKPNNTSLVTVNDETFYRFSFQKGDTVIKNTTVLRVKDVPIEILSLYLLRGKSPWYITPEDKARSLETSGHYADIRLGLMPELVEILVGQGLRDADNTNRLARLSYKTEREIKDKAVSVSLSNVAYGPGTTFGRLTGSNQSKGLVSSLIVENEVASGAEVISRA